MAVSTQFLERIKCDVYLALKLHISWYIIILYDTWPDLCKSIVPFSSQSLERPARVEYCKGKLQKFNLHSVIQGPKQTKTSRQTAHKQPQLFVMIERCFSVLKCLILFCQAIVQIMTLQPSQRKAINFSKSPFSQHKSTTPRQQPLVGGLPRLNLQPART